MSENRPIRIHVPAITRVEGEGALHLEIDGGQITRLTLEIFEPPRFFEKFLEGRTPQEVIDIVARICGICPVAYQVTAVQAIEKAFGIQPTPWSETMRRVLYCGEWIQSHALHIHMLAAPDFLGFDTALQMGQKHPEILRRGLHLQRIGNRLICLGGARSVHPIGLRPGGFFRIPDHADIATLIDELETVLPQAEELVEWTASLPLPATAQRFLCVALQEPHRYAIHRGEIVTSTGLRLTSDDYENHFREHQVPHSTALWSLLDGQPYLVGPLARINLGFDTLPEATRRLAADAGIHFPSQNPYHGIIARALEIHFALVEALTLLRTLPRAEQCDEAFTPVATTATACSEAPRGLLWHRYAFHEDGSVGEARIVPPTSQNQARIEQDLREALQQYGLERDADELRRRAETVIRNYDPCISCATHFIRMEIDRG